MTSMTPESMNTDFTHMYRLTDIRSPDPKNISIKSSSSIFGMIKSNPDNKYFTYMIRLADMNYILDDDQIIFTILVPSDNALKSKGITDELFINMDKSIAKQIVNYCILNNNINKNLFQSNPIHLFSTLNKISQLLIINIDNKTTINNTITILEFDKICSNGIIHIIDDIPSPYII